MTMQVIWTWIGLLLATATILISILITNMQPITWTLMGQLIQLILLVVAMEQAQAMLDIFTWT